MQTQKFLSVPQNRISAVILSQRVLARIAPEEREVADALIEPLLDMAASGERVTFDSSDEAGGFGSSDLMVAVVVPVVVTILGKLLSKIGEDGIDGLKKKLKREKEGKVLINITVEDVSIEVRDIKAPLSKTKIRKLTEAINAALVEYLAN